MRKYPGRVKDKLKRLETALPGTSLAGVAEQENRWRRYRIAGMPVILNS